MLSESFRLVWGNSMTRKPSPASSRGEKWVSSPDRSSTVRGKAVNPYDQSGRQYRVTGRCPVSRSGNAEKRSFVFWQSNLSEGVFLFDRKLCSLANKKRRIKYKLLFLQQYIWSSFCILSSNDSSLYSVLTWFNHSKSTAFRQSLLLFLWNS